MQALLGGLADEDPPLVVETDHARREELAECIGHQFAGLFAPDRDEAVGGSQVDPYDHCAELPLRSVKG